MQIVPFSESHLPAAAALLAARQRADRARAALLPARFADPAAALPLLREALATPRTGGVAAIVGGELYGYLLGELPLPAPLSQLDTYIRPRGTIVEYAWHAVAPADAAETYRALYAALAPRWLAAGSFSHYIFLPAADTTAIDAWFSLGFGQESVYGVRSTETTAFAGSPEAGGVSIRRAGPDDLAAVLSLLAELERHHAQTPVFRPFFAERDAVRRAEVTPLLADPAHCWWLAEDAGRAVGLMLFEPPAANDAGVPARSVRLSEAITLAAARGAGVGGLLLRHGLAAARSEGYTHCVADWVAPNLAGDRYWRRQGFAPLRTWLCRHLDPRIAWAGGGE